MPVADHFMAFDLHAQSYAKSAPAADETVRIDGEVCELCYSYCAGGKAELWRHVREEHGADRSLTCPVPGCGRRFFARFMSAAHSAHHHSTSVDRPFTCELCGNLLQNCSTFERHMVKVHPDTRAAMCGVCHLYKGDVPSLVDHVRRRHGDEVGQDAVAGNGDATRRHIRCDVCGKRYGNNRNMYVHRLVHGVPDATTAEVGCF